MSNFIATLKSSAKEFKNIKSLITCSLLIALNFILGYFTVAITPEIHVGISFLTVAVGGYLFGPILGGTTAATCDILKAFLQPRGPFFPGFTISAFVGGFIYGLFMYKKRITISRIAITKILIAIIPNIIMNTYWLSLMFGKTFWLVLPARVLKSIVLIPIEVILIYLFLKFIKKYYKKVK